MSTEKGGTIENNLPCLHVYGQQCPHGEVWIVGNKEALEALQSAIGRALDSGCSATEEVFANDGEGYKVSVVCRPFVFHDDTFGRLMGTYPDSPSEEHGPFKHVILLTPWDILTAEELARLRMKP